MYNHWALNSFNFSNFTRFLSSVCLSVNILHFSTSSPEPLSLEFLIKLYKIFLGEGCKKTSYLVKDGLGEYPNLVINKYIEKLNIHTKNTRTVLPKLDTMLCWMNGSQFQMFRRMTTPFF